MTVRLASTVRCTNSSTVSSGVSNRLKQGRGLATRTDKLATTYHAALHLAGILIWTRC